MMLNRESILVGLRKVGIPGLAAIALLAASAWSEWVQAPQTRAETRDLHAQAIAERDRKAVVRPVDDVRLALAATYARMPDDRSSNATLEEFLKSAKAQGLALDAVQFHTEPSPLGGVVRHQVQVPVKGGYQALRNWISISLLSHRGISLDSLQLTRKDALSDEIEAQTTWSLWADTTLEGAFRHAD